MATFTMKQQTISALKWTGNNTTSMSNFVGFTITTSSTPIWSKSNGSHNMLQMTKNGILFSCMKDDYVIALTDGTFYFINSVNFNATYS